MNSKVQDALEVIAPVVSLMVQQHFSDKDDDFLVEKEIDNIIEDAKNRLAFLMLPDEAFEIQKKQLKASCDLKQESGLLIVDQGLKSWYPERKSTLNHFYWNRFKEYLRTDFADKFVNPRDAEKSPLKIIDDTSDKIMDLLGDPQLSEFSRKGLILGDVQSGKTINFTALMNKAADAGYKLFIVLTGTIESLRQQTQKRLERDFIGIKSSDDIETIGVGKKTEDASLEMRPLVLTTEDRDVGKDLLDLRSVNFDTNRPVVVVCKKNVTVLKSLKKWLKRSKNKTNALRYPVLILDDEADHASVNTATDDEDPTRINGLIRELLTFFRKKTYVAVTATPFANVFINPDTDDDMLRDDLFPKDFVYALESPNNYVGVEKIFGINASRSEVIQLVEDLDGVLKSSHKKDAPFEKLPESLKKAIAYFLLLNAVLDKELPTELNRSMLIHISHLKVCHKKISKKVSDFFAKVRAEVANYAKLIPEEALKKSHIAYLKSIWDEMGLEEKTGYTWRNIQQIFLYESIKFVKVLTINSDRDADKLNYNDYPEGLRAIVIGGNSLSRGLTLEGLMVSYFRRSTIMYDTLMQMGRWFGYNLNKIPYGKVWLPSTVEINFSDIADAYTEFKSDIAYMYEHNLAPKDFGIQVRRSSTSLLPTARNKMRSAKFTRNICVLGSLIATPRLPKSALDFNERLIRAFISELNDIGEIDLSHEYPYWRGIPKESIAKLVYKFISGEYNLNYQGKELSKYIRDAYDSADWDVTISSVSVKNEDTKTETFELNDGSKINVLCSYRKVTLDDDGSILISGSKVKVETGIGSADRGLTLEQKSLVREIHDKTPGKAGRALTANDFFIKELNRKPILFIYPIEMRNCLECPELEGRICFAIGLGFPGDKHKNETVEYVVNVVRWREINALLSDDGEDE